MEFHYKKDYSNLSDEQIVRRILAEPHDEEAAAYMLHDRYAPLLYKLYRHFTKEDQWFDDCIDELFLHIKGKESTWHTLATFEWRSTFGYWLKGVAWNKFCEILPKLIENDGRNLSIDSDDAEKSRVQIPDDSEENYERRQRKVMLLEAIGLLKDPDQRFVILKRLEGYRSKEIAYMLQAKWEKYGTKKYNNKGELVVPDAAYVDVRTQRAKENLQRIMDELK